MPTLASRAAASRCSSQYRNKDMEEQNHENQQDSEGTTVHRHIHPRSPSQLSADSINALSRSKDRTTWPTLSGQSSPTTVESTALPCTLTEPIRLSATRSSPSAQPTCRSCIHEKSSSEPSSPEPSPSSSPTTIPPESSPPATKTTRSRQRLKDAGEILGIKLLDHLIVTMDVRMELHQQIKSPIQVTDGGCEIVSRSRVNCIWQVRPTHNRN
jgi:hypothetical protein